VSELYPAIGRWVVPGGVKSATLAGVRPSGRRGSESGAFWLGTRAAVSCVTTVVLPQGEGVEESPGQWRVSPEVFGAISRWAKPRGLTLLGIAHTHVRGVPPRLSWADRHRSVRVPGILAVVIGRGGEDVNHRDWGWYVFETGDYREIAVTELEERVTIAAGNSVNVWRADAKGVWELGTGTTAAS
jgi:proteasome lid subunit RPN8/RPN11